MNSQGAGRMSAPRSLPIRLHQPIPYKPLLHLKKWRTEKGGPLDLAHSYGGLIHVPDDPQQVTP